MNRRQFNLSLGAALAAPTVPMAGLASVPAAPVAPTTHYLFADLIARSRGHLDVGFLARRLNVSLAQSQGLVDQLIANNVLQPPNLAGMAKAVNPIRFDMHVKPVGESMQDQISRELRKGFDEPRPTGTSDDQAPRDEDVNDLNAVPAEADDM